MVTLVVVAHYADLNSNLLSRSIKSPVLRSDSLGVSYSTSQYDDPSLVQSEKLLVLLFASIRR